MRNILILDVETTGLDPLVDVCIEVAVILYSVEHATTLRAYSSLMRATSNAALPINGIPVDALRTAPTPSVVWSAVEVIALEADAICAHRSQFDRAFVSRELREMRPWFCTKFDLSWPKATRIGESLVPLALAHGLGVSHAHRAMADCDLLSRLFSRVAEMGIDMDAFMSYGLRPKAKCVVRDRSFSAERNALAKAAGFAWDNTTKSWHREMAVADMAALQFAVDVIT